jgi:hypothetical protein
MGRELALENDCRVRMSALTIGGVATQVRSFASFSLGNFEVWSFNFVEGGCSRVDSAVAGDSDSVEWY